MVRSPAEISNAVAAAKEVFWRQGYESASMEDVVQATGLNRYALYSAFGGKRDIFLATLGAYHEERRTIFLTSLEDADRPPLDAIRHVSTFCINEMADRGAGCLMCNVAMDVAREDEIVSARVHAYLAEIEKAFIHALERADARGELNPTVTPESAAKFLVTMILGVGMRALGGASRGELLEAYGAAINAVGVADIHYPEPGASQPPTPDHQ